MLFLIVFIVASIISSLFIWIWKKASGFEGSSTTTLFISAIFSSLVVWGITYVFSMPEIYGMAGFTIFRLEIGVTLLNIAPYIGWTVGIFISFIILKLGFKTDFRESIPLWTVFFLGQLAVLILFILYQLAEELEIIPIFAAMSG